MSSKPISQVGLSRVARCFCEAEGATRKLCPMRHSDEEQRTDSQKQSQPSGIRLICPITASLLLYVLASTPSSSLLVLGQISQNRGQAYL